MTDRDLLIAFQQSRSHDFFARIVHRHASLVYAHARRLVKNQQLAEDIAQEVFLTLFREAANINPQVPLVGWLFVTTRHRSLEALRAAARRHTHERKAAMSHEASHEPDPTWNLIAEDVDDAVNELTPDERHAILLRYFAGKTHHEIAAELSISDEAAKKRVQRAVASLRLALTARGAAIPATALAAALTAHAAAEAAPATLAAAITSAATLIPATAVTTAKGVALLMTLTKTKIVATIAIVAALIVVPIGILTFTSRNRFPATPSMAALPPAPSKEPATSPSLQIPDFQREYSLHPDEVVRFVVAAPAVRRAMFAFATQPDAIVPPDVTPSNEPFLLDWHHGRPGNPEEWGMTEVRQSEVIKDLSTRVLSLRFYEFEFASSPPTAMFKLPGDIVSTTDLSPEKAIPLLETAFQKYMNLSLKLSMRNVERRVFVLHGRWTYTPIPLPNPTNSSTDSSSRSSEPPLEIYGGDAFDPQATTGGAGTSFNADDLALNIGAWFGEQMIIEVDNFPKRIDWRYSNPSSRTPAARISSRNPKLVLDHVTQQTGLTWSEETRTVRRLIVEPQ